MCNLYSMTTNVEAIRRLFEALNSCVGNLPSMPGIFPDYPAPIVRNSPDGREIIMARWRMPSSKFALMQATKKRAAKLEAKGKSVECSLNWIAAPPRASILRDGFYDRSVCDSANRRPATRSGQTR